MYMHFVVIQDLTKSLAPTLSLNCFCGDLLIVEADTHVFALALCFLMYIMTKIEESSTQYSMLFLL